MTVNLLLKAKLVAIVRLDDLSLAGNIVDVLVQSGVTAIEFTLTNADAPKIVRSLRQKSDLEAKGVLIGLGSVRSLEEAKLAVECGSQFVVSPITSLPIIEYCKQKHIGVCPGAMTPTEIALAWDAGADIVKVFPAKALGPGYIRDVLAPMPHLKLMPTGGVDLSNIDKYFAAGAVAVGIGSQLLDPVAIRNQDWNAIGDLASLYVSACHSRSTK